MVFDLGSSAQLRRPVVLVDHATEDLAPLDRQLHRRAALVIVVGRSLLTRLVRAVPVVMAGVLAQNRAQVPFAVDDHPVGALASCSSYPSLGITVRPRSPRRDLDWRHWCGPWSRIPNATSLTPQGSSGSSTRWIQRRWAATWIRAISSRSPRLRTPLSTPLARASSTAMCLTTGVSRTRTSAQGRVASTGGLPACAS